MRILCVLSEKLYPGIAFISGYGQHAGMAEFLEFYSVIDEVFRPNHVGLLHFLLLVAMEGW